MQAGSSWTHQNEHETATELYIQITSTELTNVALAERCIQTTHIGEIDTLLTGVCRLKDHRSVVTTAYRCSNTNLHGTAQLSRD